MEKETQIVGLITGYKNILVIANQISEYNTKTRNGINQLGYKLILLHGTGDYVGYAIKHCKKSELLEKIKTLSKRLIDEHQIELDKLVKLRLDNEMESKSLIKQVGVAIDTGKAKLIGEGEWVKDSAYLVYEFEGRYYSVIVYDRQNKWLMDETIKNIEESEIDQFINRK